MVMEMTGPRIYQAIAVKHGLKACKVGVKLNTAYTPTNLFAMVHKFTGVKFKRGQYDEAISAMEEWLEEARHTSNA